jgi:beta-xylosidase
MALSDAFQARSLGLQWRFWKEHDPDRYEVGQGRRVLRAEGTSPSDSPPLTCIPTHKVYEAQVEVEISEGAQGGLILYYSPKCFCGVACDTDRVFVWRRAKRHNREEMEGRRVHLKLRDEFHDVSLFTSTDGSEWRRIPNVLEKSGYHHNVFDDFMSLRLGLYAAGSGSVTFRDFRYRGIE